MLTQRTIQEALVRLDAEIAAAEAKLQDLRVKRQGADAFLEYAEGVFGVTTDPRTNVATARRTGVNTGNTALIEAAVRATGPGTVSVEDVVQDEGVIAAGLDRMQVRNGLHYLSRKGLLESAGRRGLWRLAHDPDLTETSAGAELSVRSTTVEGGENTDDPTSHDRGHDFSGRNHDSDHLGAAVGA